MNSLSPGGIRKYGIYATGEIILVVVGILLALSINNWNQQRINRMEEQRLLNSLIRDLELTIINAERCYNSSLERLIRIKWTLDSIGASSSIYKNPRLLEIMNADTFKVSNPDNRDFTFQLASIRYYFNLDYPVATYQEFISTGKIGIIRNDSLRSEILDFYNKMDSRLFLYRKVEEMRDEFVHFLATEGIGIATHGSKKEIWPGIQKKKELIALNENLASFSEIGMYQMKLNTNSIQDISSRLIAMIKEEIK